MALHLICQVIWELACLGYECRYECCSVILFLYTDSPIDFSFVRFIDIFY